MAKQLTVEQFVRRFQKVAKKAVWTSGLQGRLRTRIAGKDNVCPIEFVFNSDNAFLAKELSKHAQDLIVNAADNGTWNNRLPFKHLRSRLLKACGL